MKSIAFACAVAAATIAAPASAATYINFNGQTGTYGNDLIASSPFTNVFNLTFAREGTFAATITSTAANSATNVNFSSVVLNGPGLGAGLNFSNLLSGVVEFRSLPATFLAAGAYTLTVTGTSGNAGSFSGDLSFAAVPEPATWALMILGMGLVGGAMRRRAAKTTVRFA